MIRKKEFAISRSKDRYIKREGAGERGKKREKEGEG